MQYDTIVKGLFIHRPNRFVAYCQIDGEEQAVHVKNTGRCRELLIPEQTVWLEDFSGRMGNRKMRYSLIAVNKRLPDGSIRLINMDSQAPNQVAAEAIADGVISIPGIKKSRQIQREKTCGQSRLDLHLQDGEGKICWVEVKGVTLEQNGVCRFPDAPTSRGVKHIHELIRIARGRSAAAAILFVIQMEGALEFRPNDFTDPEFGRALREAQQAGVHILAYDCRVTPNSLQIHHPVPICLDV